MRYPLPLVRGSAVRSLALGVRLQPDVPEITVAALPVWREILRDTMTGDGALSDHVSDSGHTPSQLANFAPSVIVDWSIVDNVLGSDTSATAVAVTWDVVYDVAHQFIEARFLGSAAVVNQLAIGVRYDDATVSGYVATMALGDDATLSVSLNRYDAGVATELGQKDATVDAPNGFVVLLYAAGGRLGVLVDHKVLLQSVDRGITQVGAPLMFAQTNSDPSPRSDFGVDYVRGGTLQ